MALIKCTQCGSMVSDKADACAVCGKSVASILQEINGEDVSTPDSQNEPSAEQSKEVRPVSQTYNPPLLDSIDISGQKESAASTRKKNILVLALLSLLIIAILSVGGYYIFAGRSDETSMVSEDVQKEYLDEVVEDEYEDFDEYEVVEDEYEDMGLEDDSRLGIADLPSRTKFAGSLKSGVDGKEYPIVMVLNYLPSSEDGFIANVSGYYYYQKYGESNNIRLSGTINSECKLFLRSDKGTEEFDGTVNKDFQRFDGWWQKKKDGVTSLTLILELKLENKEDR